MITILILLLMELKRFSYTKLIIVLNLIWIKVSLYILRTDRAVRLLLFDLLKLYIRQEFVSRFVNPRVINRDSTLLNKVFLPGIVSIFIVWLKRHRELIVILLVIIYDCLIVNFVGLLIKFRLTSRL